MTPAAAIDAEAVSVTLTTQAAGAYDAGGNWVPGGPSSSTIQAVIQPASGAALQDLPEGIRAEVLQIGWTRSAVALGDEITYSGTEYRVLHVRDWSQYGFNKVALGGKD